MGKLRPAAASDARGRKTAVRAELYPLFLAFNRRLLATLHEVKPPLSVAESHILAGINLSPGVTASELVPLVRLEKSTVSRALRDIIARSLVAETPSREDRRRKQLTLTTRGIDELRADSLIRNLEVELTLGPLNSTEQLALQKFLQQMADNLEQPSVDNRSDDHPVKQEIRRLTRGMGFIGSSCMGTGYPTDECQVLQLVLDACGALPMAELFRRLPYDRSTVSRLISKLERDGLICKSSGDADRRSRLVRLARAGAKQARANLAVGEQFVLHALRGVTAQELKDFSAILSAFVLEDFTPPTTIKGGIEIVQAHAPRERFAARAFLVEQLVRSGQHQRMPPTLLADDSIVLEAHHKKELLGVAEITLSQNGATLRQLVWSSEVANERRLVTELCLYILAKLHLSPITIDGSGIDTRALLQLFPKLRRRVPLTLQDTDQSWLETPQD